MERLTGFDVTMLFLCFLISLSFQTLNLGLERVFEKYSSRGKRFLVMWPLERWFWDVSISLDQGALALLFNVHSDLSERFETCN